MRLNLDWLKGEVEGLRIRAVGLRESKTRRADEVAELRSRLTSLRKELKEVEASLTRAATDADRVAQATRDHHEGSLRDWEQRVAEAQKVLERERDRSREERQDVLVHCSEENHRIREKISSVESKKSSTIETMKRLLIDYRKRNDQLQAELETGRSRRLDS